MLTKNIRVAPKIPHALLNVSNDPSLNTGKYETVLCYTTQYSV